MLPVPATLFAADSVMPSAEHGRTLQGNPSNPDAPNKKSLKTGEEAATARHEEMMAMFCGVKGTVDKMASDQKDLTTKMAELKLAQEKSNEIMNKVQTDMQQVSTTANAAHDLAKEANNKANVTSDSVTELRQQVVKEMADMKDFVKTVTSTPTFSSACAPRPLNSEKNNSALMISKELSIE